MVNSNGTNEMDEVDDMMHPYWRQWNIEDIPAAWHAAVGSCISIIGIIGTTGNAIVIWTFLR